MRATAAPPPRRASDSRIASPSTPPATCCSPSSPTLAGDDGGFIRRIAAGPDERITGGDPGEIITHRRRQRHPGPVRAGRHPPARRRLCTLGTSPSAPGGALYVAENNGVLRLAPGADGLVDGSADETVTRVLGTPLGLQLPFQGDGGPARDAYAALPQRDRRPSLGRPARHQPRTSAGSAGSPPAPTASWTAAATSSS